MRHRDNDRQNLRQQEIRPAVPTGLRSPPTPKDKEKREPTPGPKPVKAIKVDERHDQRKRELGDESEWWALAAVVDALMELSDEARDAAIGGIKALLKGQFEGKPVDRALAHAERAGQNGLDDEERIEELSGLLHVSRYSDAFGFDMVGWLPTDSGGRAQAVCLEVKNSSGGAFQFSRGEWPLAEKFHADGRGSQYAILVVRRRKAGGVPTTWTCSATHGARQEQPAQDGRRRLPDDIQRRRIKSPAMSQHRGNVFEAWHAWVVSRR